MDFAQRLLGPAWSAPGAVNAVYSRAISVATAALAFRRKWLSAREKVIENGSPQLEIRHLAWWPRPGFGRVENITPLRTNIVNDQD